MANTSGAAEQVWQTAATAGPMLTEIRREPRVSSAQIHACSAPHKRHGPVSWVSVTPLSRDPPVAQ